MSPLFLLALLAPPPAEPQTQLLPGSCRFEDTTCGYVSDPDRPSWTLNEEGHFITAESSSLDVKDKFVLVSPRLELLDWNCVRLVYQITGAGSLQLHLRPEGENFDFTLWTANKPSDSWLIASVDLPNTTKPYQETLLNEMDNCSVPPNKTLYELWDRSDHEGFIERILGPGEDGCICGSHLKKPPNWDSLVRPLLMEGTPGQGEGNSLALFEIHIVPGYCIECNFEEHHLCGYNNQWNPNVNWYVGGSLARDPQSNLPDDHTMNNERGHYMYVDSVYAKRFQEVAKLSSPMTTTPMSGCLSFYYQRDQARGNFFSLFTKDELGHYEEIWRPDVYATSTWKLVQVDIKAPHPIEAVFEVAFNSARGGYVALDDISFSPQFCHQETEPIFDPSISDCDFEEGYCQYYQERIGGSVWNRVSVKPNVYRIGDHTTGTGSFLLANTRFTNRPGYVGRLHGPLLPENHKYCLRFYYTVHGFVKMDNALALYLYEENNVAQEKIWTISETSRDVWTEVDLTFQKPMPVKIVFVTICRNFWDCGLVALDDITVTLGDCQVAVGPLRPPTGQCNFELGDCGYIQEKNLHRHNWIRTRGQTPTSYTGPRGDHTLGVGYFMYIEASHMLSGHSAHLVTPELRGSDGPQCLSFFYHMYGSGTGLLSVLLHRLHHGTRPRHRDTLLWKRQGEQSISWMRAMIEYECRTRHQIVFEATRGPSIRSDIAIDDIVFKHGSCKDSGDSIPYSGFSENFNEIEY